MVERNQRSLWASELTDQMLETLVPLQRANPPLWRLLWKRCIRRAATISVDMRGMRSETAHAHYIGLMHLFAASPLLWAKDYVGRLKPEQITILENVFGDETPTASDVLEQGMVVNAAFQEDRQWDNECECDECDECDNA